MTADNRCLRPERLFLCIAKVPMGFPGHPGDVLAIDRDAAGRRVEEGRQQVDQGRLTGAERTDQPNRRAGSYGQADAMRTAGECVITLGERWLPGRVRSRNADTAGGIKPWDQAVGSSRGIKKGFEAAQHGCQRGPCWPLRQP
jgi:hypothetical protein